jgi:hypothetical protein
MNIIDTAPLVQHLIANRNSDGGWGYYRGKTSRLEPTAWAILALAQADPGRSDAAPLASWPAADGLLLEHAGGSPNYGFQGLAMLVLAAFGVEHAAGNGRLAADLERVKGVALENGPANPTQDNRLQAWSWTADTFSWVEPTAWCLLSLKKYRQKTAQGTRATADATTATTAAARINEAERLLINRACVTGGWNYGNADVLGQDLRAYVPTTAIGLLAMQDRQDADAITRSVQFLASHGTSESSGSALALAMIALRTCGRDTTMVKDALQAQIPMTLELGNHAAIATALYASAVAGTYAAFTL